MRGDFDLKIPVSVVAVCCLMQLPDSSLWLDLVTLIKLSINLEIFLLLILGGFFLKKVLNMSLQLTLMHKATLSNQYYKTDWF